MNQEELGRYRQNLTSPRADVRRKAIADLRKLSGEASHFGNAILIAKRNGTVRFKDIRAETQRLFQFPWQRAEGFNTGNSRNRAVYYDTLMHEWIRDCWNGDSGNSPGRMYSCLKPAGVDDEGNRIFEYHGERNV